MSEYVTQDECPHLEAPTFAAGICPTCLAVVDKCEECSKVHGEAIYHVLPACEPYKPPFLRRVKDELQALGFVLFHVAAPAIMPLYMRYYAWKMRRQLRRSAS